MRSWAAARMVISPRKQRGSEMETSPLLAQISTSRFGRAGPCFVFPSGQCCFFFGQGVMSSIHFKNEEKMDASPISP